MAPKPLFSYLDMTADHPPQMLILQLGEGLLILQPTFDKYGIEGAENILLPKIPWVLGQQRIESKTGHRLKPEQEVAKLYGTRHKGVGFLTLTSKTEGSVRTVEIVVF